jgi:hypothetical protein
VDLLRAAMLGTLWREVNAKPRVGIMATAKVTPVTRMVTSMYYFRAIIYLTNQRLIARITA